MRICITGCKSNRTGGYFFKKYSEVLEFFGKIGYYKGKQVCVKFNKLNFN